MFIPVLCSPALAVSFTPINHLSVHCWWPENIMMGQSPLSQRPLHHWYFCWCFSAFLFSQVVSPHCILAYIASFTQICSINWPHIKKKKRNLIFFKVFWVCIRSLLQTTVQPPSTRMYTYTPLIERPCKRRKKTRGWPSVDRKCFSCLCFRETLLFSVEPSLWLIWAWWAACSLYVLSILL